MKSFRLLVCVCLASASAPALVHAQDLTDEAAAVPSEATPAAAPAAPHEGLLPSVAADGCELHIWPAERMNSVTTGLLGGGLLDAALHSGKDASNKSLLASALDSQSQLDALLALDLREELALSAGTTFVVHDEPLERKTMNKVKTRRSDSQAACYSELIVADVFYQKAAIYGRSLKTLFMLRKFDAAQKIAFEYKAWGGNGLKLFPPKEGEDTIAALDELVGVFKANFSEYAKNERTTAAARVATK
ncbi:hypothetical protein [Novosphingobium decolorationis]|uniref:Methanolan biosynthesis EpsI domain-containing protein n=1 Tax=Novosphingobium decolorationis TaxID=2698673 RepID=A0ABX8E5P9_9SPHN|nr:hypothetical protein [Novosphingobium decolorationis]QVM83376.1 hypothetical protein HT578_06435 [Novosphingobium decolorationis]